MRFALTVVKRITCFFRGHVINWKNCPDPSSIDFSHLDVRYPIYLGVPCSRCGSTRYEYLAVTVFTKEHFQG
jgi:hypothetical protein